MFKYSLRTLKEKDLDTVLRWRNDERIRQSMYNDQIITEKQHQQWFKNVNSSKTEHYFIFTIDHTDTGFVSFKDVDHKNNHCYWGFYIGEAQSPKGSGSVMGFLALEWAFQQLEVEKVYGEVLSNNEKSLSYHQSLGFSKEGHFRNHIVRNNNYLDVIRYGLLKEEWIAEKPKVMKKLAERGIDKKDLDTNFNELMI
ncbi:MULTISPECIES: UDP-4-amino-4,6-dideoxy-N-acetyl-beta-L-altrosamine N-acetyltransferase [Bacillus]|uniref:UDP-4-amino-4, 6-dideoxy-N-acetyl-beta-L-altrosamine N-acetyltransferase n=1 Tax=Bacillus inaquosorum TaxID=483913 RepID=A0A9Q4EUN4_9BACI|nr:MULTISPECIES: UDP-4-amino-4,6-dideoxy-N-acetyl-beta-L-altrosamine N-acetyltransferase [Bacillus]MCE0741393.1 UDP-4-amino-4,6-dideoxy-N-acetyl-beta-L-altrosamine N-acetyltransferase [Bacillus sp. G16]PPA35562.1 UDP-4-amino-4,6-dideoxy-N-acetyl-beta-L-altrosamine N-acetyltransferase [Bacillus subtilis]AMA54163.1 UDP-4-amino-4,6-dideoxy-N-acetyl-beta-L-altrosamine N-acetyltransferase [Bacillus inaquosorum]MBT2192994.1 UDP-4-amino-4,6-dideoxy-N-acetyl-beta-L-altrosamine N-acetyltransferase [Baci